MKDFTLRKIPLHGYLGILLVGIFWYLNWSLHGLRTHWGFFPLWVGYCLTMDALVFYLKGDSLLTRNLRKYVSFFLISIPGWWLFELFNIRMENWSYVGKEFFTDFDFFLLASFSFSTVMPAVFSTAELMSILFKKQHKTKHYIKPTQQQLLVTFISGIIILLLILIYPEHFYFLIWVALYFVIDPINVWLGYPNLLIRFFNKDFRPLLTLGLGALMCGFFWEMWNYYSYPKWEYYLPMVNFLHVFEMPVLGYIGYVPFSLELYAMYCLIAGRKLVRSYRASGQPLLFHGL